MKKLTVSVIVLNYQGEKIIEETVLSLEKLDYPKECYEIIIVDNNSQDKSKEIIKNLSGQYDNVKYIFLPKNIGFSAGNNAGIRMVQGKYVALLNNDCIVDQNWLKEIIETAEKDDGIFAVNSKIILYGTNKIQNAGIIVFQDGYGRDIGAVVKHHSQDYEKDQGQYEEEKEVYAACGAAVLYRKEILDKIGYLDEHFFMYYEDVEISERARANGYKIYYSPKAVVYHHHALSSKEWSPSFIYNAEKGRLLHVFYHFPLKIFLYEYWSFFTLGVLRALKEIRKPENYLKNWQYFKTINFFLFNFPSLIKFKNKIYNKNTVPNLIKNYDRILSGYWYLN